MQVANCVRSFDVADMCALCTMYEKWCYSCCLFISWFKFMFRCFPYDSSCYRCLFKFCTRRFLVCVFAIWPVDWPCVYAGTRECVSVCSSIVFHRFSLIRQTNIKLKIHIAKWMWIIKMPSHFSTFYLYRSLCLVLLLRRQLCFFLVRSLCCLPLLCSVWSSQSVHTLHIHMHTRQARTQNLFYKVETFVSFDRYWSLTPPTKRISKCMRFNCTALGHDLQWFLSIHMNSSFVAVTLFTVWNKLFFFSLSLWKLSLRKFIFTIEIHEWWK